MNNDVIKSLEEFKAADQATRDYFIFQAISGLDSRFSGKWVEKLLIWLGIVIGTGILGYLGVIIVKAIDFFSIVYGH